jgi:8-hydroxy-5-deazaflavin:NADPH oxidoreductase
MSVLAVGFDSSAAEEIQQAVPGVRIVKAFNTVFAQILGAAATGSAKVQVLYAGDDDAAKQGGRDLIESAGFDAVDAGPLATARSLEPMGLLNIYLGYVAGRGTGFAPAWVPVA